uniref:LIM zinc-binding domain-containing protein n=1 Tax=Amphiprion ocellaris TaxID=80972 RepID=A0AAQ5ZBD5_AMPOC
MNPPCARCGKIVYPTEKVSCLDKNWHKGCFHCEVCKMTLNMKNYKGYDKKPYCNAHYPKTSFTIVADTPENLRLRQQSELQSQVKYKKDFEESKGRGFSIVSDTPEMQRLRKTQEQISNAKYHEDFERARGRGFTPGLDDPSMERYQRANQMMGEAAYSKGIHPQAMEMDRRPGGIIVDLKVWRTDPGSIFDFDPLEDNIQSKSLRRMSGSPSEPSPTVRLTIKTYHCAPGHIVAFLHPVVPFFGVFLFASHQYNPYITRFAYFTKEKTFSVISDKDLIIQTDFSACLGFCWTNNSSLSFLETCN